MAFDEYVKKSEHDPIVIVQIEHIDALDELDAILAVDGVDSICIGPCDLSASMGLLGQVESTDVERVVDEICAKARAHGMMLGAAVGNGPETISRWRERGANWLAVAADYGCIYAMSRRILSGIRA
jgi:2-dehydro-3-deoxyglucarate aldolase/4-hydroxy-2-oxoheptanedioate aldolase